MFGDDDGGILRDVASGLLGANLDDEASESAQIDVLTMREGVLHGLHELLDGFEHIGLVDSGRLGDLVDNVSFSHFVGNFIIG